VGWAEGGGALQRRPHWSPAHAAHLQSAVVRIGRCNASL